MFDQMQVPDVPSSLTSSYVIGPMDPTHLTTLQARLSNGLDISLPVPAHYIFEKNCCGPSPSTEFVSFLQRKFADEIEVRVFDLGKPNGLLPLPPSLLAKIQADGGECLPALVVDGTTVAERKLPNFLEAVELVRTGQPSQTSLTPVLSPGDRGNNRCC